MRNTLKRPRPPERLLDPDLVWTTLTPAPEVGEWIQTHVLAEDGRIHNPDHGHLIDADIRYLWASSAFSKQMRTVVGQAEQIMIRAGGWQKARQEQQFREWFGHVPDFIITFAADYAARCSDTDWCALVEHELFHIGQQKDEFGAPSFTKDGIPKLALRGHDVEEFVGVVKRYGAGDPNGAIAQLAAAARGQPAVARSDIAGACGTCLLRAA